jgi:hypothetical protein
MITYSCVPTNRLTKQGLFSKMQGSKHVQAWMYTKKRSTGNGRATQQLIDERRGISGT